MIWFSMIKLFLYAGSILALIQLSIMANEKYKHPERIKEIYRIYRWVNYQMVGCGILLGFIIKLAW